jgi:hypothetical protein
MKSLSVLGLNLTFGYFILIYYCTEPEYVEKEKVIAHIIIEKC